MLDQIEPCIQQTSTRIYAQRLLPEVNKTHIEYENDQCVLITKPQTEHNQTHLQATYKWHASYTFIKQSTKQPKDTPNTRF